MSPYQILQAPAKRQTIIISGNHAGVDPYVRLHPTTPSPSTHAFSNMPSYAPDTHGKANGSLQSQSSSEADLHVAMGVSTHTIMYSICMQHKVSVYTHTYIQQSELIC